MRSSVRPTRIRLSGASMLLAAATDEQYQPRASGAQSAAPRPRAHVVPKGAHAPPLTMLGRAHYKRPVLSPHGRRVQTMPSHALGERAGARCVTREKKGPRVPRMRAPTDLFGNPDVTAKVLGQANGRIVCAGYHEASRGVLCGMCPPYVPCRVLRRHEDACARCDVESSNSVPPCPGGERGVAARALAWRAALGPRRAYPAPTHMG